MMGIMKFILGCEKWDIKFVEKDKIKGRLFLNILIFLG